VIPIVSKTEFHYCWPIDWLGLHREYLNVGEMEVIASILRGVEAKSMMEIGCRDGRTAKVLLHNVAALNCYVGIDVRHDYVPTLKHQRAEMVPVPGHLAVSDPRFDLIIRENGSLDLTFEDIGPVDAAFIDGDHSKNAVLYDSRLAKSVVRPGGVIIWHDYCNAGVEVKQTLDHLSEEGWPIKAIEGTWLAYLVQ